MGVGGGGKAWWEGAGGHDGRGGEGMVGGSEYIVRCPFLTGVTHFYV